MWEGGFEPVCSMAELEHKRGCVGQRFLARQIVGESGLYDNSGSQSQKSSSEASNLPFAETVYDPLWVGESRTAPP